MNTKMMEQFEVMDTEMLAKVEGSFGGWGDMISGLLGGLAPSPTLDQLMVSGLLYILQNHVVLMVLGELQTHVMVFKKD